MTPRSSTDAWPLSPAQAERVRQSPTSSPLFRLRPSATPRTAGPVHRPGMHRLPDPQPPNGHVYTLPPATRSAAFHAPHPRNSWRQLERNRASPQGPPWAPNRTTRRPSGLSPAFHNPPFRGRPSTPNPRLITRRSSAPHPPRGSIHFPGRGSGQSGVGPGLARWTATEGGGGMVLRQGARSARLIAIPVLQRAAVRPQRVHRARARLRPAAPSRSWSIDDGSTDANPDAPGSLPRRSQSATREKTAATARSMMDAFPLGPTSDNFDWVHHHGLRRAARAPPADPRGSWRRSPATT